MCKIHLLMDPRCKWFTNTQDTRLLFVWHILQHLQLLSKLVRQPCFREVSCRGWLVAVRAAHQCVVPQGFFPFLPFLAAAAQGVISKVAFGWSASKSYYLLIGFVLALLCLITNCLSHIRSTMRWLSAAYKHFVCKTHCLPAMAGFALGKPQYGRQKTKAPHFKHCSISCSPVGASFPSSPVDGGAHRASVSSSGGLCALCLWMQSHSCFPDCLSAFPKECPTEVAIKQESIKKIQE